MATYEYRCEDSDATRVTIERSIKDPEVIPECQYCNLPMVRVFSSPTVVFNAKGFYSTGG